MNRKHKYQIFFAEDDGAGGSGGAAPGDPGQPSSVTTTAQSSPTVDAAELAKQFGSVIGEHFKQQTQSAPKTYSPEEIAEARKNLKFWEPNDGFIQKFGNLETQRDAFVELRDGLTQQNIAIVQALLQQQWEQWKQQFTPMQEMLTQRNEAERESRFYAKYPALAKPELRDFVMTVGQKLASSNAFKDKSESDSFTLLANGVESVIKSINPEFTLGAATTAASSERSSNSIPSHSSGGGGGGGGASSGKPNLPIAAQVLGPVVKR